MTRHHRFGPLLAVLLVMGVTPAALAQPTFGAEPRPLTPAQGQLVTEGVEVAVELPRQLGADGPFVRQVSFFNEFFDPRTETEQRFFVGFDDIGVAIGESPRCDLFPGACVVDGVWHFTWQPFEDSPTGPQALGLEVFICPQPDSPFPECEVLRIDSFFDVFVDLTPPFVEIVEPAPDTVIDIGDEVALVVEADPIGSPALVAWTFQPVSFLGGKGLPLKDQHVEGADLSGDNDDDGRTGDSSCAPTAAASSLAWFAMDNADDFGGLLPAGDTMAAQMKALTDRIGELAGTDDDGTSVEGLKKAIEDYLEENDLDDDFEVELDEDPSLAEISAEFGRGQDVLLGVYGEGFAHRVAVENVTRLEDGSTVVNIMDPWSGLVESITVGPDGQAQYDPPWTEATDPVDVDLDRMIHVSPTADADEVAIPSGDRAFAGVPGSSITWDTTGVAPGAYLIRATATDADGTPFTATTRVTLAGDAPTPFDEVVRLSGAGRELTAVQVAGDSYADGAASAAVLARADAFPDALAGTPLAAEVDGPLLLTGSTALSSVTADELERAVPSGATVYLLGGEAALSADVADAVEALGYTVRRLGGASRTETAAVIAEEGLGSPATVLLTTGDNFPDALGAGVAAAAVDGAVLLTAGTTVPPATQAYLDGMPGATVFAIGGPAAGAAPDATPIVGASRFETAVMVAEAFFSAPTVAGLATGADFPDALAGGAHIARLGGPILLTDGSSLSAAVEAYLEGVAATTSRVYVYGGVGVVSDDVADAAATAIGG
ncbi:cell wall-binding repeat-containing protein [Euzebya pacifica]|mgnify:FL=1|jgi:hypothetical protein|uniref:cell wall-binding repeat-containing protein n=1 Tax=Euzebya pacifica TaxID=1608957 RepID=UPI0030FB8207